jgi:hypothetical protein
MLSRMDVRAVLLRVTGELRQAGIEHALIGALAMAPHGAGRGTHDVDLLAQGDRAGDVNAIVLGLGYQRLQFTREVGNYASDDPEKGRVDFLFANRPPSRGMLRRARPRAMLDGLEVPVVDAEDLIGLKVQSSSNNPRRRARDMDDVERLLDFAPGLDLERVREYFRLFEREREFEELLAKVRKR